MADGGRALVLRALDGLLTLLGEIIVFFGVYLFLSNGSLALAAFGLFLLLLGQSAGVGAIAYEKRKRLEYFYAEALERIGGQFAYPVLIFALYVLDKSALLLTLAFALTLIAVVKSIVIFYKAKMIENIIS